jgi:predicted DNA-binding transcriptional regulator AlpA
MALINTDDAAAIIGVKPQTLEHWRMKKNAKQPPYIKLGKRRIVYDPEDLHEWLRQNRVMENNENIV